MPSSQSFETIAIPDEQDRKRFIGCLAAVLASLYDHDVADEIDDTSEVSTVEDIAYFNSLEEDSQQGGGDAFNTNVASHVNTTSIQKTQVSQSSSTKKISLELQKIRLSRSRHRKRRYDVATKFLLDCTKYLRLEEAQAKAFLPILSKLLAPQSARPQAETDEPRRMGSSWLGSRRSSTASSSDGVSQPGSALSSPSSEKEKIISQLEGTEVNDFSMRATDIFNREVDDIDFLRPFLESMSPGGGFRCLVMVLLQHLLLGENGYDARVRHAVKRLGVLILVQDMENDPIQIDSAQLVSFCGEESGQADLVTLATRRFESLEHFLAKKIIDLSREQEERNPHQDPSISPNSRTNQEPIKGITREQMMRGLKVGAVGVAAASLFAVTGGLAAPGIAAAAAAIAGGTAVTAAAAAMLTSTAAVTAIFGVGGGTLVAYKMNRRTVGVTEFEFRKETGNPQDREDRVADKRVEAELFTTIAIGGWLRDLCDYQRPWGVSPSNPWISDRVELLERFYAIHRPENIAKSKRIVESWEGEEQELWSLLKKKYGRDPDHLFPLESGPRVEGSLTLDQQELLDKIVIALGFAPDPDEERRKTKPFSRLREGWKKKQAREKNQRVDDAKEASETFDDNAKEGSKPQVAGSVLESSTGSSLGFESVPTLVGDYSDQQKDEKTPVEWPKHIDTVWDYQANYGGELYTVRWESDLLTELCDSVSDLAFDLVSGGTAQLLKHTALSAVMSAVAWPYALVNAANMIDGTWTLAVERSDEAGRELARSLLFSTAGRRPVCLIGYSFGARVIYSCLKELARYQEKWCEWKIEQESTHENVKSEKLGGDDEDSFDKMREPASIVEDVVMMGLPNHMSITSWQACRQVVAGRLVNCFSQKDLILSLMFQVKRLKLKAVCGCVPIAVGGVESIDVSNLISGHEQYCTKTGKVLKKVRHGEPFRSRPTHMFEVQSVEEEQAPEQTDKYDV